MFKILICIYAPLFLCILGTAFYYMCIHEKSPLPLHISGIPDNRKNQRSCLSMADIIDDAILNTAKNMIKLGGYIVIFSCISAYINVIPFKNDIVPAVICGITEITNGIYIAGKINADKKLIIAQNTNRTGQLSSMINQIQRKYRRAQDIKFFDEIIEEWDK